jgi:hypothetical protein
MILSDAKFFRSGQNYSVYDNYDIYKVIHE